jgi:hypothetical protein
MTATPRVRSLRLRNVGRVAIAGTYEKAGKLFSSSSAPAFRRYAIDGAGIGER